MVLEQLAVGLDGLPSVGLDGLDILPSVGLDGLPLVVRCNVRGVLSWLNGRNVRPVDCLNGLLDLLMVDKATTASSRLVFGRFLRLRCAVQVVPRAIAAFVAVRELRVVGIRTAGLRLDLEPPTKAALACASRAIAAGLLRSFWSYYTDTSAVGWIPEGAVGAVGPGYALGFDCCDERGFDDAVVANLAKSGGMVKLAVVYPKVLPSLSMFARLTAVVLQEGTFNRGEAAELPRGFASRTVTSLEFDGCQFGRLPSLAGFPALTDLVIVDCDFDEELYYTAIASLNGLADEPPPPIARLVICGGTGIIDASPIAGLARTLRTLVMRSFTDDYPDFVDEAAGGVVRQMLEAGELNASGTGCLCKFLARRLAIDLVGVLGKSLTLCTCCLPCDCGTCGECDE
jgi:hypothetical protein